MYPGQWALANPDKAAAINSETAQVLSYKQLEDNSNRLAQFMWRSGLRPGDHIAIFLENNLAYFEIVWAALRSGMHITPINRYLTPEEAVYIVNHCGAKALFTSKKLGEVAKNIPSNIHECQLRLMVDGVEDGFSSYEKILDAHDPVPLADQPRGRFMFYSSGTTGRPKGIKRELTGAKIDEPSTWLNAIYPPLWKWDSETVYLSPAPLYHGSPLSFSIATQSLGGTVIMMPRFDAAKSLKAIEDYKVTHSQWVPTMFTRMLKLPDADRQAYDLSTHKYAIHAAAPCPVPLKHQMFDWWGPIIYEYYSGSEGSGFTHCGPQEWLDNPGTVGKSIMGTIHICDEAGEPLPVGEAGMIYFEMPDRPFEYHNDEEGTKKSEHPKFSNWTALGDIGYVNEGGYLFLTDRASYMIISGGVNIYPQEIEDCLTMHPKVADVAVIGVPDKEMGEAVKAVIELAENIKEDEDLPSELIDYTREHIAHYKCPKSIDFVDKLPRLPTGKLYKRILKDKYWGKIASRII